MSDRQDAGQHDRPNIVFIMSDDHAAHAISAYGSRINETPNLDRIADDGMRMDSVFCTNSICTPSRASILTGTYSHVNGALTLNERLDSQHQVTFAPLLQQAGYQTAIYGKWHLGHLPPFLPSRNGSTSSSASPTPTTTAASTPSSATSRPCR